MHQEKKKGQTIATAVQKTKEYERKKICKYKQ